MESKREDIYVQVFTADLQPLSEPLACDGAALQGLFEVHTRLLLVGDAAERALEMLGDADLDVVISTAATLPDAAIISAIAATRKSDVHAVPQPLYLRPPDAKLPKAQGRLRV